MISVIIPVYNVEKYLEQCVNSIIKQSYKDIEIILVDDGSTDNSGLLCDKFQEKDKRVKVIHKKNSGLGMARNSGLELSTGKYVTFIDSDDYADKNLIFDMLKCINETNADTCIGGFRRVLDNGEIVKTERYNYQTYEGDSIKRKFLPRMLGSLPETNDSIRPSVWNSLYSLDIIRKNKIEFPSEREYISEDIIFDLKYYQYSKKIVVLNNVNYFYRVNENSLTRKYKKNGFEMFKKLYEKEIELSKKYNIIEETKYRIIRQFFVNVFACIKQEKRSISKKSINECLRQIKFICNDKLLRNIINIYPVNKLGFKQKVFIYLIKFKCNILLYILTK